MKNRLLAGVLALSTVASPFMVNESQAALVVIDPSNLAQQVKQVLYWAQQLQEMKNQLQQQITHYKSIVGSRNLGLILNDPALKNIVPKEAIDIYASIQSGDISKLTDEVLQLRNANKIYDCEGKKGQDFNQCQAFLIKTTQDLSYAQNAFKSASKRVEQIQALMSKINDTDDPKSIAEIQARIQAETTSIANEQNRLLMWRAMADTQDKANLQAFKEKEMKALSTNNDGSNGYQYQLPQFGN
jgi:type IV secretion system protein VirB5